MEHVLGRATQRHDIRLRVVAKVAEADWARLPAVSLLLEPPSPFVNVLFNLRTAIHPLRPLKDMQAVRLILVGAEDHQRVDIDAGAEEALDEAEPDHKRQHETDLVVLVVPLLYELRSLVPEDHDGSPDERAGHQELCQEVTF